MLDHRIFLSDFDGLKAHLGSRGVEDGVLNSLAVLVEERRRLIQEVEEARHQQNEASQEMPAIMKAGDNAAADALRDRLKVLKAKIKEGEDAQRHNDERLSHHLLEVPNIPAEGVPVGKDESANRTERTHGDKRSFEFEPKPHWELGEALDILDFERASRMSGARFVVYKGAGARLERALLNFMLDNAGRRGFTEVIPPLLVREDAMLGSGQYPKFKGESFETLESEYALIPTSEVPLVNLHREEILELGELPRRYCAFTPCFRREAGAAGRDTRGLIRQHQFNKVELVSFTTPERSFEELEYLTATAEDVLKALELPYRLMTLCTGDMGFCAAKTFDIEVWLPGQGDYREISSCSNCTDFQARRAKVRYRPEGEGKKAPKPQLVHTLNGSGLAIGRTVVAILENYQEADGSITIPKALVPYFGAERIEAA